MQETGIAVAEPAAIGGKGRGWDGRIAPARVAIEDRGLVGFYIVTGGVEAVVVTLLLNGLEVDCRGRRRVDRLGMGTSGQ